MNDACPCARLSDIADCVLVDLNKLIKGNAAPTAAVDGHGFQFRLFSFLPLVN